MPAWFPIVAVQCSWRIGQVIAGGMLGISLLLRLPPCLARNHSFRLHIVTVAGKVGKMALPRGFEPLLPA